MEEYNNRGRLLAALPLFVDGISIYSPTLKQIFEMGESMYAAYLGICTNDDLHPLFLQLENKFDNILNYDDVITSLFLAGLEFFTRQTFIKDNDCFIANDSTCLHKGNFDTFVRLLKLANCIDVKRDSSKDIRNKELDEKIAKAKAEVNKKLGRKLDEDKIMLLDLISVLASKHNNLNIMNIWELNYFQFNDQFQRMQLIENYDMSVRQLLAGVDKKHVNLEHYIKKIK